MTPSQKIRHLILLRALEIHQDEVILPEITAETIDWIFNSIRENDESVLCGALQDATEEIRGGTVKTDIEAPSSKHYESKSVAAKMPDGTWVGWTYWHGGGKHGNPEEIEWIEEAYHVECTEEEKVVTIRTFKKV